MTCDLTDEQWNVLKALLPLEQEGPGRPLVLDMRQAVNAIFYFDRTICQWENLLRDYPNYNSVYYHYRKWCRDGVNEAVPNVLRCPPTPLVKFASGINPGFVYLVRV